MAKRISYDSMNSEQKARAEQWAKRWNRNPKDCPMLENGLIVTNKPKNLTTSQSEDYDIISKGYVDKAGDITDEIRSQYRKDMELLAKDHRQINLKR